MGTTGDSPRVSIGLPVYNGERYLAQAIRSLLAQTFGDFELHLCDNASTDGTSAICRRFTAEDSRVRYHRNDRNLGAAPNFNRAFGLARGRYFKWAAHDDLYAPTYLARCVEVLDSQPQVVLCHTRAGVIGSDGRRVPVRGAPPGWSPSTSIALAAEEEPRPWDELYDAPRPTDAPRPSRRLRAVLTETNWCFEIFGLMRAEVARRSPLHQSFYGSDKVMLASMALAGPFAEVPEELFLRRHHPAQSSSKSNAEQRRWIDTAAGVRPVRLPPQLMCLGWYLRLVGEAHLTAGERARCMCEVARWTLWLCQLLYRLRHRRGLLYRLRSRLPGSHGRRRAGPLQSGRESAGSNLGAAGSSADAAPRARAEAPVRRSA